MFAPPETLTLRFTEDSIETQSAIAAATKSLLRPQRANSQLRIVLAGDSLAAKTIAALISALRELREVGGAIELRAENKAVRQIILRHGLEGIFEFPTVSSAPAATWSARNVVAKALTRIVADFRIVMGPPSSHLHKELWMIW